MRPKSVPRDLYHPAGLLVLQKELDAMLAECMGKTVVPPTADEIAMAREAGPWRDSEVIPHDEVVQRILDARDKLSVEAVSNAFVSGVGQGVPAFRSAISSYAIALHLEPHVSTYPWPNFPCSVCGLYRMPDSTPESEVHWNYYLRSRIDSGGTSTLPYVLVDLEDFPLLPCPDEPSRDDIEALRDLLGWLRTQPSGSTPGKLAKEIGNVGGKNQRQRTRLIEVLAIIGVLEPSSHRSFLTRFTPYDEREGPDGKNDWDFPALWWRGTNGVNEFAVEHWFGHLL